MARLPPIRLPVERCERCAAINARADDQHSCLRQSAELRFQHQGSREWLNARAAPQSWGLRSMLTC